MKTTIQMLDDNNQLIIIDAKKLKSYKYVLNPASVKQYPYFILTNKDNTTYKISFATQFHDLQDFLDKNKIKEAK